MKQGGLRIDFAYLDSTFEREREAEALAPMLSRGALVVLHDAHRPYYGVIAERTGWRNILIHTQRGVAIFQAEGGAG